MPTQKKYTKNRAARKRQPVENRAGAVTKRRRYAAYDGQRLLGTFILNERTGIALAWDSERRFIGRFTGYEEAARGIGGTQSIARPNAEARKAAVAEARRRAVRQRPSSAS